MSMFDHVRVLLNVCTHRAVEHSDDASKGWFDAGELGLGELEDRERLQQDEVAAVLLLAQQAVVDGLDACPREAGDEVVWECACTDFRVGEEAAEGQESVDDAPDVPGVDHRLGALHADGDTGAFGIRKFYGALLDSLRAWRGAAGRGPVWHGGLDGVPERVVGDQDLVLEGQSRFGAGGQLVHEFARGDPALDGLALVAVAVRGNDGVAHALGGDGALEGVLLVGWVLEFHLLLLFLFYKGRKKSFGKRKVFLEGKKILGLYRLQGSEGGVDTHTQKKTDWRGGSRTHGPRIFEIFVMVLFEGDGIKHAWNGGMAEARGLRDIREGRTGDPATAMVAVGLGLVAGKYAHKHSAKVRNFVDWGAKKLGRNTPSATPSGELILPFGWERHHTKRGMMYHNLKTNETRNTPPPDSYEEYQGDDGKPYWHSDGLNKTVFVRPGGPAPPPPPPDHNALPTNWTEHEHNGQKFYHNALTGVSQHERPTAPGPPVVASPVAVTRMNSKKNRNKQPTAVPEPTPTAVPAASQPTSKKGRNTQAVPRIDPFAAPAKSAEYGAAKSAEYILNNASLKQLIVKLDSAVAELQKRMKEVDKFVAEDYKSRIEKYDLEALKEEGKNRRPAILYSGTDKKAILEQMLEAQRDSSAELVQKWKDTVVALETESEKFKATIAAAGKPPEKDTIPDRKALLATVIVGLQAFSQKLKASTTACNRLKNKLGKPFGKLETKIVGSTSACRTVVLQYELTLSKMRK